MNPEPITIEEFLKLANAIPKNIYSRTEIIIHVTDHHLCLKSTDDIVLAWIRRASVLNPMPELASQPYS